MYAFCIILASNLNRSRNEKKGLPIYFCSIFNPLRSGASNGTKVMQLANNNDEGMDNMGLF